MLVDAFAEVLVGWVVLKISSLRNKREANCSKSVVHFKRAAGEVVVPSHQPTTLAQWSLVHHPLTGRAVLFWSISTDRA